ncbi:DJ-1/PfpI family protein [Pseudorhodoplanes sp.]|uniref:DJ-1/PfpI family protein n=1 Tax=Pseudorhodoplanes sp. TaxID=1934341 RepID=UPI002B7EF517|nr:DJ-1/PfpI family protein [Pseudorhodoplanes sp.]HWV52522.1 DJ-1/PfpI family protein [Pseudorhodoplanes sp.]
MDARSCGGIDGAGPHRPRAHHPPTRTRETAAPSDLLVIPGGPGVDTAMLDEAWLAYVRREAERAKYVFGICTGSFMLAAAGLLTGRRAGGHWQARDLLAQFGAIPSDERMTIDGKYYTSGGVTSGIDAAFRVVADVKGEDVAQQIQLLLEYDPAPPFAGGTPFTSPPHIVAAAKEMGRPRRERRETLVEQAAQALNARRG